MATCSVFRISVAQSLIHGCRWARYSGPQWFNLLAMGADRRGVQDFNGSNFDPWVPLGAVLRTLMVQPLIHRCRQALPSRVVWFNCWAMCGAEHHPTLWYGSTAGPCSRRSTILHYGMVQYLNHTHRQARVFMWNGSVPEPF